MISLCDMIVHKHYCNQYRYGKKKEHNTVSKTWIKFSSPFLWQRKNTRNIVLK